MKLPSRSGAAIFGRYLLMQLPGCFLAAVVLSLLVQNELLSARVAYLLFGLWVAGEIALFPVLRVGYEVGTVHTGTGALVGSQGVALDDLDPEGNVRLGAERWRAMVGDGAGFIPAGGDVRVREVRELTLVVEAVTAEGDDVSGPRGG